MGDVSNGIARWMTTDVMIPNPVLLKLEALKIALSALSRRELQSTAAIHFAITYDNLGEAVIADHPRLQPNLPPAFPLRRQAIPTHAEVLNRCERLLSLLLIELDSRPAGAD